jgi:two-component system phosphate regulon sensor histidine kinase PhoR
MLAVSIAGITTGFISLLGVADVLLLFVCFGICFSTSFILMYFTLEFFVLAEINEAYTMLAKMKKKDFKLNKKKASNLTPIQKLNDELHIYATNKQHEIDQLTALATYRREFLADVSHELKTPIFAAQGFVHTLIDGAVDDEEVRYKFLQKAANSLDSLNSLVEDLFTLSQMEAGIITMQKKNFDVVAVVDLAFEQLEEKASKKNIHLIFEPEEEEIKVFADPEKILRVFINLINNAIKYGKENGKVEIILKQENEKIIISVIDDGKGIPPEHLDRIFERFYRIEKSRSKEKGGAGLGLAIVKHILEAHKVEITAQSKVEEGTNFTFFLYQKPEN